MTPRTGLGGGEAYGRTVNKCIVCLDSNLRIAGGTVDIGAYEFQSPQSLISYAWLQQYNLPADGVGGLNYFLERGTHLGAEPSFLPLATDILGQSGTTTFMDTNAIGAGPFFYRVGVQE